MTWQSVAYFLLWAGMFAVMMRFGCGAHVMGHRGSRGSNTSSDDGSASSDSVTDPVCRMTVQKTVAKSALYQERPYYFCSSACRDKFEASPQTYASSSNDSLKEQHHGCC